MSNILKFIIIMVGIVAGGTVATVYYLNKIEAITNKVNVKINDQYIVADIARTASERARGLSGRDGIGLNEGMYFIFDAPGYYGFWMKVMRFPIDLIWISEGKIVGFEENMRPPANPNASDRTLKNYLPPQPVDRVLEIHAGRIRLLKARIGDMVQAKPLMRQNQPVVY